MTTRPESKSSVSHHRMPPTATTAPLINYPFLSLNLRNTSSTAIPQYIVHALGSNSSYAGRITHINCKDCIVFFCSVFTMLQYSCCIAGIDGFPLQSGLVSERAAVVIFSGLLRPWQGSYSYSGRREPEHSYSRAAAPTALPAALTIDY